MIRWLLKPKQIHAVQVCDARNAKYLFFSPAHKIKNAPFEAFLMYN